MRQIKLAIIFVLFLIFIISGIFYLSGLSKVKQTSAENENLAYSSEADWIGGSLTNIDSSSSPGSIKIQDKTTAESQVSDESFTTSTNADSGDKDSPLDGNTVTRWMPVIEGPGCESPNPPEETCPWWKVDMGSLITNINKIKIFIGDQDCHTMVYYSADDSEYNLLFTHTGLDQQWYTYTLGSPINARYIKFRPAATYFGIPLGYHLCEFEIYSLSGSPATHTTGSTQIDGGENFWDWETFTPTQTVPANTSVSYRYRSSADGATWNAWHSSFGDVESRSGDTKYRYLQVEATLSNTDGASTPIIDSYTIGYHTNQKPNAPTAMTAVVN